MRKSRKDLSTLTLPTNVAFANESFFGGTLTTLGGDTVSANTPNRGPSGTLSANVVPEPATLTIAALGLLGVARRRK